MNGTRWLLSMTTAAFFVLVGTVPAHAQERVVATIPFDFIVGRMHLPAGQYAIDETANDVASIDTPNGRHFTFALTQADSSAIREDDPHLGFTVLGKDHFLTRIVSDDQAWTIPVTGKAMERQLAAD